MKNNNNNNKITIKELIKKLVELDALSSNNSVVAVKDGFECVLGCVSMSFDDHVEIDYYTLDPDDEEELVDVRSFMLNLMNVRSFNLEQEVVLRCDDMDDEEHEIESISNVELDRGTNRVKLVI